MVFRLEESIAAVCAPSPGPDADLRVCQAVFESRRYLVYAAESLLVVLVEAPAVSSSSARDQAKSASRFELWQVWNAQDPIRCVRFNSSKKVARGALALCIDEGRGVLFMPASATSSRAAAMAEASRASTLGDAGGVPPSMAAGSDLIPRSDYVKAHLHLHLPRWAESVRWKCDDRLLNHLEWVESGDDLFLLGAGEKMSIWKLVDDSVHVYLQRTVTLSSDGADTHVGETFICGNVALEKTFAVHLTYGVLSNGDFCIFRVESIPFSGVSPRLSLLLRFSDLREQLADAHVYSVSSSDYQDQESESASFFVEIEWSNSSSFFKQTTVEAPAKDYSMVVGLHKGGKKLKNYT
ncbi:hypothetical protein PRNP1_008607 [Phytophthora ramorum]